MPSTFLNPPRPQRFEHNLRVFIRGFKLSGITPSDIYRAACNEFGTVLSSKKILTEMRKQGVDTGPEFDV